MLRKLALVILPLALLLAACGGSSSDGSTERDSSQPDAAPTAAVPEVISDAAGPPSEPTARPPEATSDSGDPASDEATDLDPEPPAAISDTGGGDDSDGAALFDALDPFDLVGGGDGPDGPALFGALNPFDFVGRFGGGLGLTGMSEDVDPSLKEALLVAADLPAEYSSLGEFEFSLPTEFGTMEMAASQFATGDAFSDEMGSMVMSAVMTLPPEALDELGDLEELAMLAEEDFADLQELEEFGMAFDDFRLLDTSGLGDGGAGLHMEINFAAFFEDLLSGFDEEFGDLEAGPAQEEIPMPDGIGMDMYMFMHGERVLMLMVMWPLGENPGLDARQLADVMNERARAAF